MRFTNEQLLAAITTSSRVAGLTDGTLRALLISMIRECVYALEYLAHEEHHVSLVYINEQIEQHQDWRGETPLPSKSYEMALMAVKEKAVNRVVPAINVLEVVVPDDLVIEPRPQRIVSRQATRRGWFRRALAA